MQKNYYKHSILSDFRIYLNEHWIHLNEHIYLYVILYIHSQATYWTKRA
jgi:hypothetical protein